MYEVALPPYILEISKVYKAHSFDQIKLRENEKRLNIPSYVEPKDNNSITSTKKKRYNYCNL